MPKYKYRPLMTIIHFKDSSLASESKHDNGFKIKPLTDMVNATFQHLEFLGNICLEMGHLVAQLVEALRHKPEGCGFNPRWCNWNFSLTLSFQPHYGPGVGSTSNRNEYQEYFLGGKGGRCVGLTTLPPSCVDCLEIWEPQPPGTLRACPGL